MSEAEMKLVVVGAGGRMGKTLIKSITEAKGVTVSAAVEREGSSLIGVDAGELAGVGELGVKITDDALKAFAEADGVIDFTVPAATVEFAALAAQARIVHIIATTGLTEDDEKKIEAASRHARIVKSGNMSLGVNLLGVLVREAAAALDAADWDIDILEMHHKHKVDAPSGTAYLLGLEAAKGRNVDLKEKAVTVRSGITGPREEGTIGFATLRGGGVIGEHSVILANENEMVTLSHRAMNRGLFADGAIKSALWARDKKPGLYHTLDVLGLSN